MRCTEERVGLRNGREESHPVVTRQIYHRAEETMKRFPIDRVRFLSFPPYFLFFPSLSFGLFRVSFLSYPLPFFVSSSVFLSCLSWWVFSSLQHSSDCHCCHPSHNISQIHKQLIIMACFLHRGVAMGRRARIAAAPGGSSRSSNIQFYSHLLKC